MSDRRLLGFAAVALMLLGLAFILRPSGNEYVWILGQAETYAEALERTAAVAAYQEALDVRPDSPLPYLSLARLYIGWRRTDDALDALEEAERLDAGAIEVGRLRVALHEAAAEASAPARPTHWTAVVEHAGELLALDPADRDVRHIRARAFLGLREWEAACSIYRELLRSDPEDKRARETLGILLLGDDPEALEHLYAAGTDLSRRVLGALAEAGTGQDPAYRATRVGRILIERHEWALAARQLELAVSDSRMYPDAQAYLGHALDQMGYPQDARSYLLKAVAGAPSSPVAHTLLGLHYSRSGDNPTARAHFETAYDLDPENPATCVEIGQSWANEGRYVAAEIWLREAVSLRPDDPRLWEILTRFYLDHNITSDDRAVRAAEELLRLVPQEAGAHDLRGWAALQVGDYDTAADYLRRAIELDAGLASAYYHVGLLERGRGHPELAQEAFTRAIDLDTTGRFTSLVTRATRGDAGDGDR